MKQILNLSLCISLFLTPLFAWSDCATQMFNLKYSLRTYHILNEIYREDTENENSKKSIAQNCKRLIFETDNEQYNRYKDRETYQKMLRHIKSEFKTKKKIQGGFVIFGIDDGREYLTEADLCHQIKLEQKNFEKDYPCASSRAFFKQLTEMPMSSAHSPQYCQQIGSISDRCRKEISEDLDKKSAQKTQKTEEPMQLDPQKNKSQNNSRANKMSIR